MCTAGREAGGRPGREAGGKPAAGRAGCADAAAADTITGVGCPPARYDAIADWYAEFSKDWDAGPADVLSVLHHLRDNFRQLGPEVANGLLHGDPPDAFLAEILDEVFIPLVIATPEQQEPRHR